MTMEGDLTWGYKHTIQYTDNVLHNYTPETYFINQCHLSKFN